ncbi:MAG: hypothetical protein ACLGI6_10845 [Gammaproteobacteria bacterium]
MATTSPEKEAAKAQPLHNEADIGSGEKTPGQLETEKMIEEIPPLPPSQANNQPLPGSPVERRL